MSYSSTLPALIILLCLITTFRYHPKLRKYRTGHMERRMKHVFNLVMMVLGGIMGIALWYVLFE